MEFGKCDLCDLPAIHLGRDVIFDGTEPDVKGDYWEKWKPSDVLKRACDAHKDHARPWYRWPNGRYMPVYGIQ